MPSSALPTSATSAAGPPLYLLDTNVLIHAARGSVTWQSIKAACDLLMAEPRPLVCVVSNGELRAFVERRGWQGRKRDQAMFLLGYFQQADSNQWCA